MAFYSKVETYDGTCGGASVNRNSMYIENDRLIIRSLEKQDLKGLEALGCDQLVYCYEPTFLMELHGTPEEASMLTTYHKSGTRYSRAQIINLS